MPLPSNGIAWPPAILAPIRAKQREHDAWYTGDVDKLTAVYQFSQRVAPRDRPAQYRGGVTGALARFWWGRPNTDLTAVNTDKLHVPLAADICQASADLLYAEAPTFASTDKAAVKELDNAVESGLVTQLAEGNEIGAALGDSYYRVVWDDQLADRSFVTPVHADSAWPEFRWGRLVAVTFWWHIETRDNVVLRHLERHELAGEGHDAEGVILHGLYQGTVDNLGQQIPLTDHKSTEALGAKVDAEGKISTQSPGLAVVHVPNQRPQRRFRQHPIGANLGRSDLDQLEPHLDKLDMVYSSWMRDIRLAKGRLIVPNFMLTSGGPGQGLVFDADQDVFTTVNAPPREDGKTEITPQQFAIRVKEHQDTANQLVTNILRTAGYGPQTFGEAGDVAQTATETDARDRRSNLTRDRKMRAAQGPLVELLRKKLAIDSALFRSGVSLGVDVTIKFPDVTQASPESLARTNQALYQAQAASAATRVAMQHPDWDEKAIADEAAAILAEFGTSVPDPLSFGGPGTGGDGVRSQDAGQP